MDEDLALLEDLARRARRGVEVRNRQQLKLVHKNCFTGAALCSWLVDAGEARARADAQALGRRLLAARLVARAGAPPGAPGPGAGERFADADGALYRSVRRRRRPPRNIYIYTYVFASSRG